MRAIIFDCFGVVLDLYSNRNESVIGFIKSLKGHYKLGMLSNVSGRASLDRRFETGELDELFDVVVPSGDVGLEKPDHRIYELTAEKLGVTPDECLFVDDIPEFCLAAEATGMQSIRCIDPDDCVQAIKDHLSQIDTGSETD